MSKKMRVVQVGVGNFGAYRREQMRKTGLFDLVACYDINPKAMEDARREDGAKPTGSYEELLDTPDVEAVIIASGGKFHAEHVVKAAERGLHVFVEKPLCSTPEETKEILTAVKKNKIVGACGHNDHSHDAAAITTKNMIDRGDLGKVASFEMTTAHSGGLKMRPGEWRADPKKNPGGMLFQCGVHSLHECMFLFGPVERVMAMMRYDVHVTETADTAFCILKCRNGIVGNLNAYHVTPYRHTFSIFGTKANLYMDLRYGDEGTKFLKQETHLDGRFEAQVPVPFEGETDSTGNLRSFYSAVRQGGECYPSILDGARAVAVVFAAEESARTGKAVNVDPSLM